MKTFQGIVLTVLVATLVACSLDSVERRGNVTIRLEAPQGSSPERVPLVMVGASPAPTAVNAFNCIGVNVLGPGIPDSSHNPAPNLGPLFDRLLRRESYCSYRGILKGPLSATITTDQEISLVVPPGAPRLIQVVGFVERNGSNDCQVEFNPGILPPIGPTGSPLEGDVYELGRAVVDLFQDQTISIALDYNSLTSADKTVRQMKCGSGSGNLATITSPVNVTIPAASPLHLASGKNHICGIFGGSSMVYCRGANATGQLGDGTTVDKASFTPTSVTGASMVAVGDGFSCALVSGGTVVQCWGAGAYGQLGNGSTTNSSTPVNVTGLTGTITNIAAGSAHACARNGSGALYCWGRNFDGQLGDGTTTDRTVAVSVSGSYSSYLSLGLSHSCAATSTGVACWGANGLGQLGNGTTTGSLSPITVSGVTTLSALAAGENHSCAIDSGLKCWGSNIVGQIGNGGGANVLSPVPITVSGALGTTAGKGFSCTQTSTALYCWGAGPQLGNGTTAGSSIPVVVSALASNVSTVYPASISGTVCVKLTDGSVKCWGDNSFGQISP